MAILKLLGSGKFKVRYDYYDTYGKRMQKAKVFYDEKEAEQFLHSLALKKSAENSASPRHMPLKQFFTVFIDDFGKDHWNPTTLANNAGLIENHIIPGLGQFTLNDIRPHDIEAFLAGLKKKKANDFKAQSLPENQRATLGDNTIRHVHQLLHQAFEKAVEWKWIEYSPVTRKLPKKAPPQPKPLWSEEEFERALAHMTGNGQFRMAVQLIYYLGLLPKEVAGLTWDCIDFQHSTLEVRYMLHNVKEDTYKQVSKENIIRKFPKKTPRANSFYVLTATNAKPGSYTVPERLIEDLKIWQSLQQSENSYRGKNALNTNLVITSKDNLPTDIKIFQKWFRKWFEENRELGLPCITIGQLRYSCPLNKQ